MRFTTYFAVSYPRDRFRHRMITRSLSKYAYCDKNRTPPLFTRLRRTGRSKVSRGSLSRNCSQCRVTDSIKIFHEFHVRPIPIIILTLSTISKASSSEGIVLIRTRNSLISTNDFGSGLVVTTAKAMRIRQSRCLLLL